MPDFTTIKVSELTIWKKLFFILSILLLIVMPMVSKDYGQTGDEWLQIEYGSDIWNYFTKNDRQALDYTNKSLQYQGIEYYGGMFDFSMDAIHRLFPSIPILTFRHFFNALLGAIMMIFTGLITFRISKKWSVAFLALLFVAFSPRLFGESMNNPKDIPFACGFAIAIYGLLAFLQDFPKRSVINIIILTLGFGFTFGVRPAGGLLLLCYILMFNGVFYLLNKDFRELLHRDNNKLFKKAAGLIFAALLVGYIIGISTWPWGLQDPISGPLASLKKMANIEIRLRVLFEGVYKMNNEMPWYYEFKWMAISNPVIVIAGTAIFLLLLRTAIKKYSLFSVFVLLFCGFFPLLYMIYKNSSVHDTWRHVFFVYTIWVVMSALAFDLLSDLIRKDKLKMIPMLVAIIALVPAMVWTVRSHPNQYVYFNELQGGPAGANGYYDLDYYQNSGKQAAEWIKKNAKPIPGRKIIVLSNMSAIYKYFEDDTSWIMATYGRYNERNNLDWDYYIATPRYMSPYLLQNELWPPKSSVYTIAIDNAPLSAVLKRNCVDAHKALLNKEFDKAAAMYDSCIRSGVADGDLYFNYGIALASVGNLDAAVAALSKAREADPSGLEILDILSRIYKAQGNEQAFAKTRNDMQAIMMRDNEYEE